MGWTAEAQRRAVALVHSGPREFQLLREDGAEEGARQRGTVQPPEYAGGQWGATTDLIEFPPFERTMTGAAVTAVAVYDGIVRLATVPIAPVMVQERVQPVLRPGDMWLGLSE